MKINKRQVNNNYLEVTYDELVDIIRKEDLIPTQQYLISNFRSAHFIYKTNEPIYPQREILNNSGEIEDYEPIYEPLIVTAINEKSLSSVAYSVIHELDVIYYDWNPDNWLNDTGFSDDGVIIPDFRGVIYFRKDPVNNNATSFDFRNIRFRRWKKDNVFSSVEQLGSEFKDFLIFDLENHEYFNNYIPENKANNSILSNVIFHGDAKNNVFEYNISDSTFMESVTSTTFKNNIEGFTSLVQLDGFTIGNNVNNLIFNEDNLDDLNSFSLPVIYVDKDDKIEFRYMDEIGNLVFKTLKE